MPAADVELLLRRLGFQREHKSRDSASAYYRRGSSRVRVSDHSVPYTAEREAAVAAGGFSWATCGWSIEIDGETSRIDVARKLVAIRRDVRRRKKHPEFEL